MLNMPEDFCESDPCCVVSCSLHSRTGKKNQSPLVHRGLVVAIFLLCLFFILTGTMANVGNERVCQITATLLHYALLSALCWMAMEVFHAFLLVHQVFEIPPPSWLFYLGGFGECKDDVLVLSLNVCTVHCHVPFGHI